MKSIKTISALTVALFSVLPSSAFAQTYSCEVYSYGAMTGFPSKEAGKTWFPQSLQVELGANSVGLDYYGNQFLDTSPKVDGQVWTAQDDLSVRPGRGESFLLKVKFNLDKASGQAALNLASKKTGYKSTNTRAYYQCE